MIDLHCHILPGIDDGPEDFSQSLEMAKIAAHDGITKIVATPHVSDNNLSVAHVKELVGQLNLLLHQQNIQVEVLFGAEISSMLDLSFSKGFSINNTKYVLVDFPHMHLPITAREILFKLRALEYFPIIAHPERNWSIIKNPNLLLDLLEFGIFVQITAGSLTGEIGINAEQCARYILKQGVVDIIASDAHGTKYRKPVLSAGLKSAAKILGREKANALVKANPEAVIQGNRING